MPGGELVETGAANAQSEVENVQVPSGVQRDLAHLNEQMKQLFPGEEIDAQSNGKSIVLSGIVTTKDVSEKAVNVAAGYVDKREEVVSHAGPAY